MIISLNRPVSEVITLGAIGAPSLMETVDIQGNLYVFLKGVASGALGSWVTYDELGTSTLLAANAIGPVAILMSAASATTLGSWALIRGSGLGLTSAAVADNADVYATATAGAVDDTVVSGDRVKNAKCRATIGSATTGLFQLWMPFMDDGVAA